MIEPVEIEEDEAGEDDVDAGEAAGAADEATGDGDEEEEEAPVQMNVGQTVIVKPGAMGYLTIYVASTIGDQVQVDAYQIPRNDQGTYEMDQMARMGPIMTVEAPEEFEAANFQLALAGDDLLATFGTEMAEMDGAMIQTVKMCDLNSRYVQTNDDSYFGRSCVPCPENKPYSTGFQSTECLSCGLISDDAVYEILCKDYEPEPTTEPEPELEPVEEPVKKERRYKTLKPLAEPDFDPQALIVFSLILFPILFIYICITCICKSQRNKRRPLLSRKKQAGQGGYETSAS